MTAKPTVLIVRNCVNNFDFLCTTVLCKVEMGLLDFGHCTKASGRSRAWLLSLARLTLQRTGTGNVALCTVESSTHGCIVGAAVWGGVQTSAAAPKKHVKFYAELGVPVDGKWTHG